MSPLLYVIFIEPFAAAVRNDVGIQGIFIPGSDNLQCKILQYADDTTCIVRNYASLHKLFNIINHFQGASGSRLNVNKSKAFVLGNWTDRLCDFCPLSWTREPIKINGFWIGKGDMSVKNWEDRLHKLEPRVESWKRRSLSLLGKALVINTVFLSQLFYVAPVYPLPASIERTINKIIFPFLWSG